MIAIIHNTSESRQSQLISYRHLCFLYFPSNMTEAMYSFAKSISMRCLGYWLCIPRLIAIRRLFVPFSEVFEETVSSRLVFAPERARFRTKSQRVSLVNFLGNVSWPSDQHAEPANSAHFPSPPFRMNAGYS